MSDEGRRDMKTMLALLESDGPFDHTEVWLANTDPDGIIGTDILGYARAKIINNLRAQLAEETKSKENSQQQLDEEKTKDVGTQAEAARPRQIIATKLRTLKLRSTSAFGNVETAFRDFQKELDDEVHTLQVENGKRQIIRSDIKESLTTHIPYGTCGAGASCVVQCTR